MTDTTAYCSECHAEGVETAMLADPADGGDLCPIHDHAGRVLAASDRMTFRAHLRCPVCGTEFLWEPRPWNPAKSTLIETWGDRPITDQGCALVTIVGDPKSDEEFRAHMAEHYADGSAIRKLVEHHERMADYNAKSAEGLRERFADVLA